MIVWQSILASVTERAKQSPAPFVVSIDGRCAAGKSSLALFLAEKLQAPVLHIDDFYLPFSHRTEKRLSVVGGHIDFERFEQEVLLPIRQKKEFLYRPYSAHEDLWKTTQKIVPQHLYIVEGSYSQLPTLLPSYQYRIFLTVSADIQQTRLLKREGECKLKKFLSHWIKEEERYFSACRPDVKADCVVDTSILW